MNEIIKKANKNDVEDNPIHLDIDFNQFLKLEIRAKEILQCNLRGTITIHIIFKCNIVKCKADKLETINANLNEVDIKDCYLTNCSFKGTMFNNSAVINSTYSCSEFVNCSFSNTSVTNTSFDSVKFDSCDLCNLVMEECHFLNCSFINCKTSNKLIEESFLFRTTFKSMTIDLHTILDNFGISKKLNTNIRLVDINATVTDSDIIDENMLSKLLNSNNLPSVYKFKIAYYINDNLFNEGSIHIDNIFDIEPWYKICKNVLTFNNTLSLFCEFLIYNYEHGHIMFWPLLKFYNLTSRLSLNPNFKKKYQIYRNLMGIHMVMVRYVEEYYGLLQEFTKLHTNNPIILLVCPGPLNADFYRQRLNPLFKIPGIKIKKVIKHNSPNELYLIIEGLKNIFENISFSELIANFANLITIFAFFISTRKKERNRKIKKDIKHNKIKIKSKISEKYILEDKNIEQLIPKYDVITSELKISTYTLNASTRVKIIYPSQDTAIPIKISVENSSHVICTVGNTIIDVL